MLDKDIHSVEFIKIGRKSPNDFTRKRKLSFAKLCVFMLGIVHECLCVAFRRFSEKIGEAKTMTEQSLSDAGIKSVGKRLRNCQRM
ncbi:MAG: hypothetical protein FWD71_22035 [Oscillospiraceae bacterium]|nr:hypothetical protein [Oscillospiraceae bacterium]